MKMNVADLDVVYSAIADPTRRAILSVLARGDANVGGLVAQFTISFNGVSKHVKVLEGAGLVERSVRGREHWLRLNATPLAGAAGWLEHYRGFWESTLAALEEYLLEENAAPPDAPAPAAPNAPVAPQPEGKP